MGVTRCSESSVEIGELARVEPRANNVLAAPDAGRGDRAASCEPADRRTLSARLCAQPAVKCQPDTGTLPVFSQIDAD